jgi:4-amino-4-deoxy-L-arabinose transferase-like glycosyltransferase
MVLSTVVGPRAPEPITNRWRASVVAVPAVLALGTLLRVLLAFLNTDANDPHLPVIRTIAFEGRFPERAEHWQAFQPKLYHTVTALLWRLTPAASMEALNRIAQLVSCAAGIATLLVVLRFLHHLEFSSRVRLVAFALVALNPQLIGMSGQATNDAFVILFGTLTLYSGYVFFGRGDVRSFSGLVVSASLAGLSKGNGLVVIIAVAATFAAAVTWGSAAVRTTRKQLAVYAAIFLVLVVPIVWEVGPYGDHQRRYGSAFVTNWDPSPRPHLFRQSHVERPGLTSVAHGLFTFRLLDLLRNPWNNSDRDSYPAHRTSVWSRVHAQAHFVHFERAPAAWRYERPVLMPLGRLLLLLGLFPASLLVWRLGSAGLDGVRWIMRGGRRQIRNPGAVLLVIAAVGYLAFVAAYSIRLRDYSSMKTVFLLPGLLGFVSLVAAGLEQLYAWSARSRVGEHLISLTLLVLIAAYVFDIGLLLQHLAS